MNLFQYYYNSYFKPKEEKYKEFCFISPLKKDALIKEIFELVDPYPGIVIGEYNAPKKDFLGERINDSEFSISCNMYKAHRRNSFSSVFYGKIIEAENDSEVYGFFDIHLFVKVFLGIWLTGVLSFSPITISYIIDLDKTTPGLGKYMPIVIHGLMLFMGGIVLPFLGRAIGQGDEIVILQALKEKLQLTDFPYK
jgi:hypothetical protein